MSKSSSQNSNPGGFGAGLFESSPSQRKSSATSATQPASDQVKPARRRSRKSGADGAPRNPQFAKATERVERAENPRAEKPRAAQERPTETRQADSKRVASRQNNPSRQNELRERRDSNADRAPRNVEQRQAEKRPAAERNQPIASVSTGSFARFNLGNKIEQGIQAAGYTSPRPIQEQSIAEILEGRDILGLAQTGTGKTAAFVLPILHHLQTKQGNKQGRPRVLILSPTRELANQIHEEVLALGKFSGVTSMTIFGGVSATRQVRGLRSKPDVLVACPGRLLDLMNQGDAKLDGIEILVLDEADHMFDMGFLPDVRRVLKALPKQRQNLLYSATMPAEIRHLTKEVLTNPHVVELSSNAPVETIEHSLYPVHQTRKIDLLRVLIDDADFKTAIVFTRTKHRAKSLAIKLSREGHRAIALQGNMSQPQRDRAMSGFKDGTFDILVATDIAARGIDVAGVSHVINFDVPNTPEAYMHRIGRTGRSECEGKAFTFVAGEDTAQVRAIEKKLGAEIERVKLAEFSIGTKGGDDFKRAPRPVSEGRGKPHPIRAKAGRSGGKAGGKVTSSAGAGGGRRQSGGQGRGR